MTYHSQARGRRPEPEPAVEALARSGILPGLFPEKMEALRATFTAIQSGNVQAASDAFHRSGYPRPVLDALALRALGPLTKSYSISTHAPILASWGGLPLTPKGLDQGLSLLLKAGQIFVAQEIVGARQMSERDWHGCPRTLELVGELIRKDLPRDPRSALAWFGITGLPSTPFQTPGFIRLAVPAIRTLLSHYSHFFTTPPNERFAPIMRILEPVLRRDEYADQRAAIRETLQPVMTALSSAAAEPELNRPAQVALQEIEQLFGGL